MHGDEKPARACRRQRRGERGHVDDAVAVERDGRDRQARGLGRLQHRRVLAGGDDDAVEPERPGAAKDGLGDGLGGRAGEHDLLARRAGQCRDPAAGLVDQRAQGPAGRVDGGRIADEVERREHGSPRLGQERRRRIMVEICRARRHKAFQGRVPAPEPLKRLEFSRAPSLEGALAVLRPCGHLPAWPRKVSFERF